MHNQEVKGKEPERQQRSVAIVEALSRMEHNIERLELFIEDQKGNPIDKPETGEGNSVAPPIFPIIDGLPQRIHVSADRIDKALSELREALI